jgi:SPP1 family phage portal protein
MKIEEIFNEEKTAGEVIAELKSRRYIPNPDAETAKKALDPNKHNINNPLLRPDKRVKVDADNDANSAQKVIEVGGEESTNYRIEKVARIKLALQKLIIKRAVAFLFGNPVAYNANPKGANQEMVVKALKRILHDVKSNSLNRKIARATFGFKECAELWYPVEKDNNNYGFKSKFKLRCSLFSPAFGDTLYPYFDETGDMTAFSREFSRTELGNVEKSVDYFETYTDEEHWLWKRGTNGFDVVDGYPKPVAIGKIPVVYAHQDEFETQDVDSLIDRLETLLSNFADTNDYHAAPKIFIKGELKGFSKKGESGAIIEGEDGSDAKYLAWQNAPESVKLEIETLLRMIYTMTQTPDISFDSVKGLGAISGIALKLLFMDAHLKVQDKLEIFDEYLQRRVNVIKAFIGQFNTALESECDEMEIEPEVTPYMLTSEIDELNYWMTANGNKPVVSQEESVEKAGISKNPKDTYAKIQDESTRENTFVIGEPVDA